MLICYNYIMDYVYEKIVGFVTISLCPVVEVDIALTRNKMMSTSLLDYPVVKMI